MDSQAERRLTNILSADVFGYSRLLGLDEAGTLATLRAYRGIMDGLIRQHRGRVVNSAGDGILAEFQSAVMAVQCAVEIQRQISERNQALEPERRMWFRIGINLGDVIVEHDDLFGEDVNIAARLQGMAEPGGILISGAVFEQVKQKLALGFQALGPQHLKNIDQDVPVYRAVLQAAGDAPKVAAPPPPRSAADAEKRHSFKVLAIRAAALCVLLILINVFTWDGDPWFQWPVLGIAFLFVLQATRIHRR